MSRLIIFDSQLQDNKMIKLIWILNTHLVLKYDECFLNASLLTATL